MSTPSHVSTPRRLLRALFRPLDGRVADINRRVNDVRESVSTVAGTVEELERKLGAFAATATESNSYVGVETRRLQESLDALRTHIDEHEQRTFARIDERYSERTNRAAEAPLEQLDGATANLINRATGHRGFASQAGLWFNPAVNVELGEGSAHLTSVNERIIELPYALGALGRLQPPAKVLEIGSAESTFALSVASLGYSITALDLHPLPYTHPNLEHVAGRFEDWSPGSERFAAAFLISTIEHFGLGAYGEPEAGKGADRAAVERVGEALADDGFMVLTTPYGQANVTELERIYDEQALAELLEGWTILDRRTAVRGNGQTWLPIEAGQQLPQEEPGVVMVVAAPRASA